MDAIFAHYHITFVLSFPLLLNASLGRFYTSQRTIDVETVGYAYVAFLHGDAVLESRYVAGCKPWSQVDPHSLFQDTMQRDASPGYILVLQLRTSIRTRTSTAEYSFSHTCWKTQLAPLVLLKLYLYLTCTRQLVACIIACSRYNLGIRPKLKPPKASRATTGTTVCRCGRKGFVRPFPIPGTRYMFFVFVFYPSNKGVSKQNRKAQS